jgi:hypothetical protein
MSPAETETTGTEPEANGILFRWPWREYRPASGSWNRALKRLEEGSNRTGKGAEAGTDSKEQPTTGEAVTVNRLAVWEKPGVR